MRTMRLILGYLKGHAALIGALLQLIPNQNTTEHVIVGAITALIVYLIPNYPKKDKTKASEGNTP